ncbi:hypothetical protein CgunFtcFv8_027887, partial [Champsocephalus gunnari]
SAVGSLGMSSASVARVRGHKHPAYPVTGQNAARLQLL